MFSYLSKTIAVLSEDIAAAHDSRHANSPVTSYGYVTGFVLEQLHKMPSFLSRPILLATAVFGMSRLWLEGSVFYKREQQRRRVQIESWRRSRFGPSRDLIKFYTSLVVLALYSRAATEGKDPMGNA
jgi:hypothetical protein